MRVELFPIDLANAINALNEYIGQQEAQEGEDIDSYKTLKRKFQGMLKQLDGCRCYFAALHCGCKAELPEQEKVATHSIFDRARPRHKQNRYLRLDQRVAI
jgi:hypothetical protein